MRVVVVGIASTEIVTFRGEMVRAMAAFGHQVLALAPEEDAAVRKTLATMGVEYAAVPIRRTGMNPVHDVRTLVALLRRFRAFRPDVVLVYGAKAVVYGSLAARLAGVDLTSAMITGVGSALAGGTTRQRRALAWLLRSLYAVSLGSVGVVFFQNPDDQRLFSSLGLVRPPQRTVLINGSGVDLSSFTDAPLPPPPVVFIMVSRVIRDKGVYEYVEAARRVRQRYPEVRLQLLGGLDSNPSAVSPSEVEAWRREGTIEYLGVTSDVRPYLAAAHVCVLPSYGEGLPRSVLEAMAMGRPILTTDVPGCRETVEEGRNGLLVPARDAVALADGMIRLLDRSADLPSMGIHSRAMAERRFDVHEVNRVILAELGLA